MSPLFTLLLFLLLSKKLTLSTDFLYRIEMDRLLRPRKREREPFSGFTPAEVNKMENLQRDLGDLVLEVDFCKKLMARFNCSKGRAGKPILKWTEVHDWFHERQLSNTSKDSSLPNPPKKLSAVPIACVLTKAKENVKASEEKKIPDLSELEFEARSSKDCAWYDVDSFLAHRFLCSGEAEVHVRFVGFGPEEDEWVNVSKEVRERSLPLEPSECETVKVGDVLLCFQERRAQARYYDAHVEKIERRTHDLRGCRCRFSIRYDHDNTEETVSLKSLCRRRWSDS